MGEGFKLLDAYVEVTASGKGLAGKVAEDIHRESGATSTLGRTGSSMGSSLLGGLKGAFTTGVVGGLVGGVVGSVTSGLTSIVTSAVTDIGSMLVTVGTDVASTVLSFNSQLENADIGFSTMLGSGQKAQSFLNDLKSFAKSTPFEFTDLVSNAQLLMGMGIAAKDVIPDLTALGDSVASLGGSASQVNSVTLAFSQMASKGTLDMGNMTQLLQGGVPSALKILAASYHVTTGKMIENISAGNVLSSDALPRLIKGIEGGTKSTAKLGGMMDKQSHTFTGALSNIQDAFQQTTASAFKPFFDVASKGLQRFGAALTGKPAEKFTRDVSKTLKPFAKEIGKWFEGIDFNKMFKGAGKAFQDMMKGIKPKDLKDVLTSVQHGVRDILPMLPKVFKLIKDGAPVVKDTAKWLLHLGGAMIDLAGKFKTGADQLNDFFDGVVKNFGRGGQQLNGFFKGVAGFFADLVKGFGRGADQLNAFFDGIVSSFSRGADQLNTFFGALPAAFGKIGGQMVDGLTGGLRDAWGGLTSTLHDLAMALPEPVRKALGIASPSKVFHIIARQVVQGIHGGLLGGIDQIKTASARLADAVMGDDRWRGTALGDRMVAGIRSTSKRLVGLSARRDRAAARVDTDQSRLADLYGQRSDYAANVKAGVLGNAGIAGLFTASPTVQAAGMGTLNGVAYQPSWSTTARSGLLGVKASLKTLLADTKKFRSNLGKLAKWGIDPYTYDELVQAGVRGGGLETSEALLTDKSLARGLFDLERQVASAGQTLGRGTAGHRFAERIGDARDQLRVDQRAERAIQVTMVVEAKKIDEVQKLIDMVNSVRQTARKGRG